jgi:hypothetical protein
MPGWTFRPHEPGRLLLLPPSLRDWLPEDRREGRSDIAVRERLYRSLSWRVKGSWNPSCVWKSVG